jgi:PAS domain S-box-containing protein
MRPTKSKERRAVPLRRQAELGLNGNTPKNRAGNAKSLKTLIQDLQIHQVELEAQNEELRRSQIETEDARRKYSDLYDFAPIGYFTLDAQGVILEANLTGAALLGLNRRGLVRRGFRRFVKQEDQETFLHFTRRILEEVKVQTCELKLWRGSGASLDARLTGIALDDGEGQRLCQVAVSDVSDWKEAQRAIGQAQRELEMRMQERTVVLAQLQERSSSLTQANDLLQVQVQERKRAEEQASRQSQQMEGLSRRLLRLQEVERHQLALDLHDQLGQVLTGIRLNLQRVQRERDATKAGARLAEAISMLDGALGQVRQWSFDLRPPLLDDLGLVSALRWYLDRQVREFVVPHLKAPRREKRFPPEVETTCFRVAQEALTNVVRHAKATHVWIEIGHTTRELQLGIRDDGVGFDVVGAQNRAAGGGSLGLLGMQERVRLCGGTLEITSSPGAGAKLLATIPLIDSTIHRHEVNERRERSR